jgi:hypothetical protein
MLTLTEPKTVSVPPRERALAIWVAIGKELGIDATPNDRPDFIVLKEAFRANPDRSLKAMHDIALDLWQGQLKRTMSVLNEEHQRIIQNVLCSATDQAGTTSYGYRIVNCTAAMDAPETWRQYFCVSTGVTVS